MRKITLLLPIALVLINATAQDYRWQQEVDYIMNISLDTKTHRISGDQVVHYTNNSSDTLNVIYYHLYFNAFQPGSMMDVRSRNIPDPDPRISDRISKLKENEIGYHRIISMTQNDSPARFEIDGTILTVFLPNALYPKSKTKLAMRFESQVPIQIRRSGRDSREGIAYSMTQWYPKIAEYDFQGWHAYPYVAREFHGVWGNFDVSITLDSKFTIAGTGILQNGNEVGHGYEESEIKAKKTNGALTWHFVARNVHDFAWAADPDYVHTKAQVPNGPMLHFFYQPGDKTTENWKKLPDYSVRHFQFMNEKFGEYLYPTYSIIQGGDGGMEYPMCTLITGERSLGSLVGVMAHEAAHSWFHGVLANNESLYPWMDEGFTDFASNESIAQLLNLENPHADSYESYFMLVERGIQEPLGQHADHYNTNTAYGISAYSMGSMFLNQIKYIIGDEVFYRGMQRYYTTWKFRHPEPNDFLRIMEKESGLQLHWFYRYWILSTKQIDYAIKGIDSNDGKSSIVLERKGTFPMPIELSIEDKDGRIYQFYIPMNELLGTKKFEKSSKVEVLERWNWTNPDYTFEADIALNRIKSVKIDPANQMADVNRKNNQLIIE